MPGSTIDEITETVIKINKKEEIKIKGEEIKIKREERGQNNEQGEGRKVRNVD